MYNDIFKNKKCQYETEEIDNQISISLKFYIKFISVTIPSTIILQIDLGPLGMIMTLML